MVRLSVVNFELIRLGPSPLGTGPTDEIDFTQNSQQTLKPVAYAVVYTGGDTPCILSTSGKSYLVPTFLETPDFDDLGPGPLDFDLNHTSSFYPICEREQEHTIAALAENFVEGPVEVALLPALPPAAIAIAKLIAVGCVTGAVTGGAAGLAMGAVAVGAVGAGAGAIAVGAVGAGAGAIAVGAVEGAATGLTAGPVGAAAGGVVLGTGVVGVSAITCGMGVYYLMREYIFD